VRQSKGFGREKQGRTHHKQEGARQEAGPAFRLHAIGEPRRYNMHSKSLWVESANTKEVRQKSSSMGGEGQQVLNKPLAIAHRVQRAA
jgi:hypothetical protein